MSAEEKKRFVLSSKVCLENAERLLTEAEMLEFEEPPSTKFFLSIISQEECAKGFLLYLVSLEIVPWNSFISRAARDHRCKQLLGLILDYLGYCGHFDFDDYLAALEKANQENKTHDFFFPKKISDALHILRYEKIGRWESSTWFWEEDPIYDKTAQDIAEGIKDREKQQSLYVELSKTGEVASNPKKISLEQVKLEYDRARGFLWFLKRSLDEGHLGSHHQWVMDNFKVLFSEPMGRREDWQTQS